MLRFPAAAAIAAALVLLSACESGTDPEIQVPIDLVIDFCSDETPVWLAYQNQGESWTRLTPDAQGTVSFTATNDVAVVMVRQNGGDYDTEIVFAANTELEAISGQICREEVGTKTVNGTVSGVVGSQVSQVGMAYSSVYLAAAQTTFSLLNVPDRPVDLVASRINVTATSQSADRLVIRRSQTPVNGATLADIDFGGVEALVPTAFGGTVTGVSTNELSFAQSYFISQLGTEHLLTNVEPAPSGNLTFYGVPSTALAAGDYHDLFLVAVDGNGGVRGVERFFRTPGTQALPLGVQTLSNPSLTEAATSPYLRMRVQLSRQAEYSRAVRASFLQQQQFASTSVTMTVTNGYGGTSLWDMTMPDLSGVSGWQNAWGLVNGGDPIEWTITAYGARPELLFGAPPEDGETVRFANLSDTRNAAIVGAAGRVSGRLPRPFGRSR